MNILSLKSHNTLILMKKHTFILVIIYITPLCLFSKNRFHNDIETTLLKLDKLVEENEYYINNKKNLIAELKTKVNTGSTEEIYWKSKNIYQEYKTFDSDSAIIWLNRLDKLAQINNYELEIINNRIERSYILSATGLLVESLNTINNINTRELPLSLKKSYFNQMSYLYSHLNQYAVSNNDNNSSSEASYYQLRQLNYIDSLHSCILTTDEDYLWNMAWKYRQTDSLPIFRKFIELKLETKEFNNRYEAMLLYALSHLYAEENDDEGMINALAFSAMADIKCANREIASLQEISRYLFSRGDIDRAYKYISLCLKNAQIYKARTRAMDIANIMDAVYSSNIERNTLREKKLERSLTGLLIITAFACIAIIIIAIQFIRQRKSKNALYKSNELLNCNIDQLTKAQNEISLANEQLKQLNIDMLEANTVKEEYIGYVFNICSSYLSKMEENRKMINRKIRSGQIGDLEKFTGSSTMLNQEMKEFYQNFDLVFLHLYPDFVDEFNKLLNPEDRITVKNNELNTELRIYALVRLGINDSTKIAEFLHVSPQTVYNNRLRVRNKAKVPKDEFATIVRKLGKINIEFS